MKHVMYYAIYDIVENSIRESIIQVLKDYGFIRIQKSVFCGKLKNQQKKDLVSSANKIIDLQADSFYLLASCSVCFGNIITLGKSFDKQYVSGNRSSMVF